MPSLTGSLQLSTLHRRSRARGCFGTLTERIGTPVAAVGFIDMMEQPGDFSDDRNRLTNQALLFWS